MLWETGSFTEKSWERSRKPAFFGGLQSILNISPDKKTCGPTKGPQNTSLPGELSWLKISLPATFHRISPPHMDMFQKLSSLKQEVISNNKIDHFCCYKKKNNVFHPLILSHTLIFLYQKNTYPANSQQHIAQHDLTPSLGNARNTSSTEGVFRMLCKLGIAFMAKGIWDSKSQFLGCRKMEDDGGCKNVWFKKRRKNWSILKKNGVIPYQIRWRLILER